MCCLLGVLAGCANVPGRLEPLSVTLSDIRPESVGLLEQEYAVKIRVQNPNQAGVALTGLSYQIDLNGKPFAKGVSRQDVTVPGFGEVVLEGKAVGSLSGILGQIGELQKGRERVTYRLFGKLGVRGGSAIPFDSQGAIELPGTNNNDR